MRYYIYNTTRLSEETFERRQGIQTALSEQTSGDIVTLVTRASGILCKQSVLISHKILFLLTTTTCSSSSLPPSYHLPSLLFLDPSKSIVVIMSEPFERVYRSYREDLKVRVQLNVLPFVSY